MKKLVIFCIVTLLAILLLAQVGCRTSEKDAVDIITIFKYEPDMPPPTGGWGLAPTTNAHPDNIQMVFNPGEEMYLGLRISDRIEKEFTFTRYTYLNESAGTEVNVGLTSDLGPVEPGRMTLVAFENPWPVPDVPGTYKLNIYLGDAVIASARFEVLADIASPQPLTPLPRVLTAEEKSNVVEIALTSPEATAWLQGRTDYRVGEIDWYAIVFKDGEATSWKIVSPGNVWLPEILASQPLSYHPGVTIAIGEGTIYQMQIAVDLEAAKVVMTTGPYPSLSSPDRFKNLTPTPSPTPLVSREQAIETASKTLPASIVERADISAEFHVWYWEVVFDNLNAEAEELEPWPLKPPPPPPLGQPTTEPYPGIWQSVIITINADTGDLKSAGAQQAPEPGPYVSREQAIQSAREMMLRTPDGINWGVETTWFNSAQADAYLRGDRWIVLFWDEGIINHFKMTVNAITGKASGASRG